MSDNEEKRKYIILFKLRKFCLFLCEILSLHHILEKAFTPLDTLHHFYCEKGNNKSEEISKQEKEEMVLFLIKIR